MIYQSDTIKSIIGGNTVASAAGIEANEWNNNHVFVRYSEEDMVGNTNVGRLPIAIIREVTSNYQFDAEPNHFGTRESIFVIRIYVATFGNRTDAPWKKIQAIKQAICVALTTNISLGATDIDVQAPVITQLSLYQDIRFTTQTSYDNTYEE